LRRATHGAIAAVGDDISHLRFNRAIARIYELVNAISAAASQNWTDPVARMALRESVVALVQLFAPMMPHLAEECWQALGQSGMVCEQPWPEHDPALLVSDSVTVVVQINGKKRAELSLAKGMDKSAVEQACLADENVIRSLSDKTVRKVIVVPDKLVNIVAG
jgi:leucyl-tRNA synthetase